MNAKSQTDSIPTPSQFLGYELGSRFTFHHKTVSYFEKIAALSPKIKMESYGETYEGRPLIVSYISSEKNIKNLEQIRKNNLAVTGLEKGEISGTQIPIVWLSYNVHGDEAASMEAAMITLYRLITSEKEEVKTWLDNVMIIIDPCLNPDGRDRYAYWYAQAIGTNPNTNMMSWEHNQPWPGGRYNHYFFDLNRDWAWLTQKESRHRIKLYRKWMPQVHVDFHEMNIENPYFFGPAAKPFHESITGWQKDFQKLAAKNHAKHFDEKGWLYFSKETFDLFYPGYGDTWPIFNGAIGFTYEQGGSKKAGLAVKMKNGNMLTLKDRLEHHYTTSISTIEAVYNNREKLLSEFKNYFYEAQNKPDGKYKSYVIKNKSDDKNHVNGRVKDLLELLDKQGISYGFAKPESKKNVIAGYNYQQKKVINTKLNSNDIIIPSKQPLSRLVKVLFEPNAFLEDTLTYDLTAWSLPYAYGVDAFACERPINYTQIKLKKISGFNKTSNKKVYAYCAKWESTKDVRFLGKLLKEGFKVRFAVEPFKTGGKKFDSGTIVITKTDNKQEFEDFEKRTVNFANKNNQKLYPLYSGYMDDGKDIGSSSFKLIKSPEIAVIIGKGVSPTYLGEIWYYFDQEINFPISLIHEKDLASTNLNSFDKLILASGNYTSMNMKNRFMDFVSKGGDIIAIQKAVDSFSGNSKTILGKKKSISLGTSDSEIKSINRQRNALSKSVSGSIYKVSLDNSHPLSFGLGESFYMLKVGKSVYPTLKGGGTNIGRFQKNGHVTGFIGSKMKTKLKDSMAFGIEKYGKGKIIYMSDTPIIRGFWQNGKLLLGNAVFFN